MKRIAIILAFCLAAVMLLTAVVAVGQTFPRGSTPAEWQQERQQMNSVDREDFSDSQLSNSALGQ